ncbi:Hypothetical predicted protein [Marmota monax]|uniref:Uncharacterized protein n=1 Tax=Marmota monax TaxID=9995 RepID=A0A5E4B0I6_MARMO|nr:Hypothetical predicted protein [Marmota monax]
MAQESPFHKDIKCSKRAQAGSPAWASEGPGDPCRRRAGNLLWERLSTLEQGPGSRPTCSEVVVTSALPTCSGLGQCRLGLAPGFPASCHQVTLVYPQRQPLP